MNLKNNIEKIVQQLPDNKCRLIAVSKTKSVEDIMKAYEAGVRDFGENKVQELTQKQPQLPADIRWHMIGHLQRNKVKFIAPVVHLIHGVDSAKLLRAINKEGKKIDRKIPCLLQIHIAEEESKFGFAKEELYEMLHDQAMGDLHHVAVKGLMGMATFTDDQDQVRQEFKNLKVLYEALKQEQVTLPDFTMEELSMGMSGDYKIAVDEGSTMVRIGSAIFGER